MHHIVQTSRHKDTHSAPKYTASRIVVEKAPMTETTRNFCTNGICREKVRYQALGCEKMQIIENQGGQNENKIMLQGMHVWHAQLSLSTLASDNAVAFVALEFCECTALGIMLTRAVEMC